MVISVKEMYVGETAEVVFLDPETPEVKRLKSMGIREGKLIDLLHCDLFATQKVVIGLDSSRIAFHADLAGSIGIRPIKNLFESIRSQAYYDSLTGCLNRHAADRIIDSEIEKFAEKKVPLALLMVDIDHFKRINDNFGHQCGDSVLKKFAEVLRGVLRRSDVLCRWGGEEFLILLRGTITDEAAQIAERIREKVEDFIFPPFVESGLVTVSIGGAGLPPGREIARLISDADAALYQAKNGGRNRVRIC
jgi:diguanylate cyclase (GGDEF)-like protein